MVQVGKIIGTGVAHGVGHLVDRHVSSLRQQVVGHLQSQVSNVLVGGGLEYPFDLPVQLAFTQVEVLGDAGNRKQRIVLLGQYKAA